VSEPTLRQTYRAIIAAVAAADNDALEHLIAEDIVDHNPVPGQPPGRAGIKYWVTMMHDAFADLTGVVEDSVVEGDKMAARVTWHGTHRGDFIGIPGTGAPIDLQIRSDPPVQGRTGESVVGNGRRLRRPSPGWCLGGSGAIALGQLPGLDRGRGGGRVASSATRWRCRWCRARRPWCR
jgi:predicted ester cyclase